VAAVLEDLESAFNPDAVEDETSSVIALSFLFNLPRPGEPGADREILGPRLADQVKRAEW
jgi:hypothetical protein